MMVQMSDDAERHVLVKLKNECGYQFTNKMESMFTDIRTSRDMMQRYKPYAAKDKEAPSDLDLSVQVQSHPRDANLTCQVEIANMQTSDVSD